MNLTTVNDLAQTHSATLTLETEAAYFLLLRVPGVDRADIVVDLFEDRRELVVRARRPGKKEERLDYWVFAVPPVASMPRASMRLRDDVLEIALPKTRLVSAA